MNYQNKKILVIEDEKDILFLLEYNLKQEGFTVFTVDDGKDAISSVIKFKPDLILLDIMLPNLDGKEILKRLKLDTKYNQIPVIMLTAKSADTDVVSALEIGADDYVTKPFSPAVLIARIRNILRKKSPQINSQDNLQIGSLKIYPEKFKVKLEDQDLALTTTEFKILLFLASNIGKVFSRYQLVDAVKGEGYIVTDRIIDVVIVSLRKKLGELAKLIETVRGVGYRFKDLE
ncbi:MAG: response regulator transcription factor [Candidatus Margulisiibacteriota bacterium]